jgi:HD-like signal output (HDOD) protein
MHARVADLPGDAEILAAARAIGGVARAGVQLWRELSDPDIDPERLRRVLYGDPGIAARVLKVANSAYYARGRAIASLERAIVVLGLDAVRGIAAAAGLDRVAERGGQGAAFLAHSTATAACAQSLAARADDVSGSEAFLAGLLHDFGLLVEWRLAMLRPLAVADPEFHVPCARLVLATWQLPADVVDAACAHHAPGTGGALAACVRLGHLAAEEAGMTGPGDPHAEAEATVPAEDLRLLGIDAAAWDAWRVDARPAALEAAQALRP